MVLKNSAQKLRSSVWPPRVLLPTIYRYATRLTAAAVWCGVLWALLGVDVFPRSYIESRRYSLTSCPLLEAAASDYEHGAYPGNDSEGARGPIVTVLRENASDVAHSVRVYLDRECRNILRVDSGRSRVNDTDDSSVSLSNDSIEINLLDIVRSVTPAKPDGLFYIPDGHFFALIVLLIFSLFCGFLARLVFLPPLFGMILAGFILRNVPAIDFVRDISPKWSSVIRNIALVIVLLRGGLSLNPSQLKRLKLAVVLLGLLPCVMEGGLDGLIAFFWLRMPWQWALLLGYVLAAISPSVVIPVVLDLREKAYGTEKGITTLIVAGASIDVVTSISLFGVFLGLTFSEGNLILDIFRAPIQVVVGLIFGVAFGFLLWVLPSKHVKRGSKLRNRFALLFGFGLLGLFGSLRVIIGGSSLAGAGALAVLVLAFVAGQGWTHRGKAVLVRIGVFAGAALRKDKTLATIHAIALISRVFLIVWQLAQPLLFALIGAEMDLQFITPSLVAQGIGLIAAGLLFRTIFSFLVAFGNGFSLKEKIFIAISWLPKATVQAAIGSIALDTAIARNNPEEERLGRQVLTIAVLAIVLTAPAGAIAISLLGPVMLRKDVSSEEEGEEEEREEGEGRSDSGELQQETKLESPSSADVVCEGGGCAGGGCEGEGGRHGAVLELVGSPSLSLRRTDNLNEVVVIGHQHVKYFHRLSHDQSIDEEEV